MLDVGHAFRSRLPLLLALSFAILAPAGCVVAPYPVETGYSTPASFDRSWAAALGALQDSGLTITSQDRATGTAVGSRPNADIVARVSQQADGSVRVEFTSRRANNNDPGLIQRVTAAYHQRMGR